MVRTAQMEVVSAVNPPPAALLPILPGLREVSAGEAELPPSLQINPIAGAWRPVPRWTSLGASALAWTFLGALGALAYQLGGREAVRHYLPTQGLSLQLNESEAPNLEGGGHQGGGAPPAPIRPAPDEPPPPPPRDLPADAPVPNALPTEPMAAPPTHVVQGAIGGSGTGNGTGSGSGTGTGSGTGSGSGAGDGVQTKAAEPLVVPYSQIGLLKVVNPDYPERARRIGLQGQVVVRVTMDENGVPYEFHVVGGEELFVRETLKVLPHWRFTPVYHLGKRVRATFDAVLRFNLA